ncbi:hypothetical protein ACHAW5_003613 [Stephanodiscus triporus]|uniref:Uncharacterized protein n=1 Tax=Stephanodiscus triporus TaxID=2934178 RepID=A0ABD3NXX4_9STRA
MEANEFGSGCDEKALEVNGLLSEDDDEHDVGDDMLSGYDDERAEEDGRNCDREREGMLKPSKLPQLSPAAASSMDLLPVSATTCDSRRESRLTKGLSPGPPRRYIQNRDAIEAELFNLRSSRNGFVKSESQRFSIRQNNDNDIELIIRDQDVGRRWHRREREIIGEPVRRAKVGDLRLIFSRNPWPRFDCNGSKVAESEFPTNVDHLSNIATGCNMRRDRQPDCDEGILLVNFPPERKKSSSDHGDKFPEKINLFHFWMSKKEKLSSNEIAVIKSDDASNVEECGTDDLSSRYDDDDVIIIEPDRTADQKEELRLNDHVANENGRKAAIPVVGIVAATSVSSLGIAFAIILLL